MPRVSIFSRTDVENRERQLSEFLFALPFDTRSAHCFNEPPPPQVLTMFKMIIFLGLSLGPLILEEFLLRNHTNLVALYANSTKFGFSTPKLYGATIFVNVVVSSFVMMLLGGKVGSARKRLAEQAKKDGDKDAELMFALPKMQAEGYSDRYVHYSLLQSP